MRRVLHVLTLIFLTLSCGNSPSNGPSTIGPAADQISSDPVSDSSIRVSLQTLVRFRDLETGSTWNTKGEATDGPLKGQRLRQIPAYSAYWFAWASFWPNTEVYGEPEPTDGLREAMVRQPVPTREILSDVPIDGIPPLDAPPKDVGRAEFIEASAVTDLADDDIVVGVEIDGDARAYPIRILNFHEIVNHTLGGKRISLTYCPLTASGINFDGSAIEFGNSGALFNNNLVMYNRDTRDLWSQMRTYGISGQDVGLHLDLLPVVQGTWAAWKKMYPETKVLSTSTGFRRNYRRDVYIESGYTVDDQIWFAQEPEIDTRFSPKEMTLGLLSQTRSKAYPFVSLGDRGVTNDLFDGRPIVIVFNPQAQMAIPYSRVVENRVLTFKIVVTPSGT